jgi:ABC-type glycerol-3-phosphate transport system substrate-binding protein
MQLAAVSAATGILAAACRPSGEPTATVSGDQSPVPAPKERIRLEWWSHTYKPWNDELIRQKEWYQEQNEAVDINYTISPGAELITKFTTAMQAGTGPDIIGAHSYMCPNFVSAGWVAEVPDLEAQDIRERFFPVCIDGATFRGRLYGYNQHIGGWLPIASQRLFEENDLSYPESWDDMLALVPLFDKVEAGQQVQAVANYAYAGEMLFGVWGTILNCLGGSVLSDDLKSAAFATDIGQEATEIFLQLVHPDMGTTTESYAQGKILMMTNGPWTKATIQNQAPDYPGKALPVLSGRAKRIQCEYVWNWLVNSKSSAAEKDASFTFIRWLTEVDNQVSMVKASYLIPTTMEARSHPDVVADEWVKTFVEQLDFKMMYPAKISNWAQVQKAVEDEFGLLAIGDQSINDTLNRAAEAVNEMLEESELWA